MVAENPKLETRNPKAPGIGTRFRMYAVEDLDAIRPVLRLALSDIEARKGSGKRPVEKLLAAIEERVRVGAYMLTAILDREAGLVAALFTLEMADDLGVTYCRIHDGWVRKGYRPREVWESSLRAVDAWALSKGCRAMEFSTKRTAWGLQRLLRGTGFHEERVTFRREIAARET